jgi:7,8-dihydroneopterin aldolase/epimerase/oxygenase
MIKRHDIRLHNAVFYAYHGNQHEERHLGGKFHVDVEMETDFTEAAEHDRLTETVNYEQIYTLVQDIITNQKFNLIETVAKRIADRILATYEQVRAVRVRVRKPGAPVKGVLDYVEVEVDERRD